MASGSSKHSNRPAKSNCDDDIYDEEDYYVEDTSTAYTQDSYANQSYSEQRNLTSNSTYDDYKGYEDEYTTSHSMYSGNYYSGYSNRQYQSYYDSDDEKQSAFDSSKIFGSQYAPVFATAPKEVEVAAEPRAESPCLSNNTNEPTLLVKSKKKKKSEKKKSR